MDYQSVYDRLSSIIRAYDPSLDTEKGPIRDVFLGPATAGILDVSSQVELLVSLAAMDLENIDPAFINEIARSLGFTRRQGKSPRADVVFWSRRVPSDPVKISKGILISTPAGVPVYSLKEEVVFSKDSALYNPRTQRWESRPVPAEAITFGTDTEIAAYRLTILQRPISGIEGVYNINPSYGGQDPETNTELVARIQSALKARIWGTDDWFTYVVTGLRTDIDKVVIGTSKDSDWKPRTGFPIDVWIQIPYTQAVTVQGDVSDLKIPLDGLVYKIQSVIENDQEVETSKWSMTIDGSIPHSTDYKYYIELNYTPEYPVKVLYTAYRIEDLENSLREMSKANVWVRVMYPYYINVYTSKEPSSPVREALSDYIEGQLTSSSEYAVLETVAASEYIWHKTGEILDIISFEVFDSLEKGTQITIPKGALPRLKEVIVR